MTGCCERPASCSAHLDSTMVRMIRTGVATSFPWVTVLRADRATTGCQRCLSNRRFSSFGSAVRRTSRKTDADCCLRIGITLGGGACFLFESIHSRRIVPTRCGSARSRCHLRAIQFWYVLPLIALIQTIASTR
jgi:hypothetical protein